MDVSKRDAALISESVEKLFRDHENRSDPDELSLAKNGLKSAISEYCRCRVRNGLCSDGDCEFCCVNNVYELVRED